MAIYIILILYILSLRIFAAYVIRNTGNREKFILRMGMFAIFLLLALKKETVGIDITGYKDQYYLSAIVAWKDTNYVYFEPGYIQLMKLFSKVGLNFQIFAAVIYAVCCRAYYRFTDRYSPNVTLSLLFFICYQFLVFYTSGLRQALAMAICIYAFLVMDGKRQGYGMRICCSALLIIAAATIHKSALLFFAVMFFYLWRKESAHWLLMTVALSMAVFVRPLLLQVITLLFGNINVSNITLGGNFIFLAGLAVFSVLACYQSAKTTKVEYIRFLPVMTNAIMLAVVLQILFSGSTLLRSTMYLTLFLIPGLPCALKRYERKTEIILTWLMGIFLMILFWTETLSVNQLELCPYLFFWQ